MSKKVHKIVIYTRQDGAPATEFKRQFECYIHSNIQATTCVWYTFGIGYTREVISGNTGYNRIVKLRNIYGAKNVRIITKY